jgi:acyl-CoA reductase-like NAD-dependent aldehyde dehydrogenase
MGLLAEAQRKGDAARVELTDTFAPAVLETRDGVPTLYMLTGGKWASAVTDDLFDVVSPIDGSLIARAQRASTDDVAAAVAAAKDARAAFRGVPAAERLEICERAAHIMAEHLDRFVDAIVVDLGKTGAQALSEANATKERLELAREEVRKIFGEYLPGDWIPDTKGKSGIVLREPVGTVAAIGPFNYPLFLCASKVIPALAAGNTVVAKAPSDDPIPLLMFACVLQEAGLPTGVLNVLTGPGSEMGDALALHEDVSMVSFTGSSKVGRRIAELAGPKPLHLELGGNAAAVVLADCDLELTAKKSVTGAFKNAGQRCDAISRVLVEEAIYDDYVAAAVQEARGYKLGDPRADDVDVGPLVNEAAVEYVDGLVADSVDKGARLLVGGRHEDCYFEPTVLADVPEDAAICWEETFGPVLPVIKVRDLDAALEMANRSRYGLDSAVFTSDLDNAWRAARELQCGMVTVNDAPAHGVGHFPFGGRKPDSGIGREGLGYSIDECTTLKTVVLPAD